MNRKPRQQNRKPATNLVTKGIYESLVVNTSERHRTEYILKFRYTAVAVFVREVAMQCRHLTVKHRRNARSFDRRLSPKPFESG